MQTIKHVFHWVLESIVSSRQRQAEAIIRRQSWVE